MTRPADTDLITLKRAVEEFFDNSLTVASLRAEQRRGNLAVYRIGKRDFTTIHDLREMQEKCRVGRKGHAFTLTEGGANGLSERERISSALAALNQTARALKKDSRNTSPANTGQRQARPR